jgi:hypothetical protein
VAPESTVPWSTWVKYRYVPKALTIRRVEIKP